MISSGIVVEYNPFHNGHAHHLFETKKRTNADCIIAVMCGNFLQRGEPALVSKYSRAKMALEAGVDLIVELPYAFATQKAEVFATGAVQILSALDCNYLCFGSESGNIELFNSTLQFMKEHQSDFDFFVQQFMKQGYSYPKATALAFHELQTNEAIVDLAQPNNILGYHYMKAIHDCQSKMIALTIERKNAGYHDQMLSNTSISSATSIRKSLFDKQATLEEIRSSIPITTYLELVAFQNDYETFIRWENYWQYLKYRLLQSEPAELREIYEMEEGLEYRMQSNARQASSFQEFMEKTKTKRYTWTRLQRVCTHILTNSKKAEMKKRSKGAEYIRLLGLSQKGRKYLKEKKELISLPVVSKLSAVNEETIRLDVKASHVYSFGYPAPIGQKLIEQEYSQPPIIKPEATV
ncbi:nucleotidyltransferase [Caldibacillus lycopersici]|uniref:tRNA(Met) cytidine acetate ligase n=1 Tax=Perspicuibacillus lycopersici TaxID=1325689 RepID=A0AAE3IRS2_9BACI|nr:nucleotidyltransferase [Perspicuibacillus lycopersici]MCU9612216.1 nucleotidyltransferase [Perspicuibacillus lycopersici]